MVSIPGSVTPESGVLETNIPENRKPCFRGPETVIPVQISLERHVDSDNVGI